MWYFECILLIILLLFKWEFQCGTSHRNVLTTCHYPGCIVQNCKPKVKPHTMKKTPLMVGVMIVCRHPCMCVCIYTVFLRVFLCIVGEPILCPTLPVALWLSYVLSSTVQCSVETWLWMWVSRMETCRWVGWIRKCHFTGKEGRLFVWAHDSRWESVRKGSVNCE